MGRNGQHGWKSAGKAIGVLFVMAIVALSLLCPSTLWAGETVVRIRGKQSAQDGSHDYFVKLLELALAKTEAEYGPACVKVTDVNLVQGRALEELSITSGIDVDWAGTDVEREEKLRPIRIPLVGGLLGYRVPVIRKVDEYWFALIRSVADLKKYIAVQGIHWPDTQILKDAGLPVYGISDFKLMYPMLKQGRVDYFLRGVNEVYAEMETQNDDRLVAFDSLIVSYKLPMYFFTALKNENLAYRIEQGLRRAINDGSFRRFMESHPATAPLFPLSRFDDAVVLQLPNAGLPKETPIKDSSLWIRLGKQEMAQ